ncbi:uncharacterized protein LOC144867472 [Branchiostoma floridae x Branchiostoma japonicum]
MLKNNQILPASQVLPPTYSMDRVTSNVDVELRGQNGEINVEEAQPEQRTSHCKRYIIAGVVFSVVAILVVAIAVPVSIYLSGGRDPPPNVTALPVVETPSNVATSRPTSTIVHPNGTGHTTSQQETTQQTTTTTTTTATTTTETATFITTTERKSCSESALYECNNGNCIDPNLVCDGHKDCGDEGDDEDNCPVITCGSDQFTCNDGSCIPLNWRCDGKEDCPNKDDELGCTTMMTTTT